MAQTFTIIVERGEHEGTLKFSHGTVSVNTRCWWDEANRIDTGTYTGYASWMANKQEPDGLPCPWKNNNKYRPGIWFGKGVKSQGGTKVNDQIFIHKGTSAAWSDGCIVCASGEVLKIWNEVTPKDAPNVSIIVSDAVVAPATFLIPERFTHRSPDVVRSLAKRHGFCSQTPIGTAKSEIWTRAGRIGFWIVRLDTQGHGPWFHGRRPHYHKNWVASVADLHAYLIRYTPKAFVYDDHGSLVGAAPRAIHPEHLSKAQHIPR